MNFMNYTHILITHSLYINRTSPTMYSFIFSELPSGLYFVPSVTLMLVIITTALLTHSMSLL